MTTAEILDELFPAGHGIRDEEGVLRGSGRTGAGEVAILGTTGGLEVGIEAALALASEVLRIVREHPRRPIVVLVDTRGQRMSLRDEVLGLNGYLAHLAACMELARQSGHRTLAVVHGDAVSGGFLPLGFMADDVHAVAGAHPWVMSLAAMARVTKIPLERLAELSRSSAVLAPGLDRATVDAAARSGPRGRAGTASRAGPPHGGGARPRGAAPRSPGGGPGGGRGR